MTFNDYQQQAYTNIKPHTDFKDELLDYSIGLCEEVGEVMNHIKHRFYGNETLDRNKFAKEVGDVLWYLSSICSVLKLDLDAVAKLNLDKLDFRFKGGYSIQKSKSRHTSDNEFDDTDECQILMKNINTI